MIKPGEIQKAASANNVSDTQIEKDYIISWILFGISRNVFLNQLLVFKGMWDKSLKNQIHQLPDFDGVFRVLMKHFRTL